VPHQKKKADSTTSYFLSARLSETKCCLQASYGAKGLGKWEKKDFSKGGESQGRMRKWSHITKEAPAKGNFACQRKQGSKKKCSKSQKRGGGWASSGLGTRKACSTQ